MPLPELEKELRLLLKDPATIPAFADLLFPEISGYPDVKLGLMCMMASQWDAPNQRERIHVLLHGKPGTGKSALMLPLEQNWNAKYISMDPSAASLRADARKKDRGSQIFNKADGGIVCVDDFELMQDKNILRDIMERGYYSDSKGGVDEEYAARCRILAATNDMHKIPMPIVNRFDLVFKFSYPTVGMSMEIVRQMLSTETQEIDYLPMLQHYIYLVNTHEPSAINKKEIERCFEEFFNKYGLPTDTGEKGGKEGRWIATIIRLSTSLARLNLGDIGPATIEQALKMKHRSDEIVKKNMSN